jgi:hypothetical protein
LKSCLDLKPLCWWTDAVFKTKREKDRQADRDKERVREGVIEKDRRKRDL